MLQVPPVAWDSVVPGNTRTVTSKLNKVWFCPPSPLLILPFLAVREQHLVIPLSFSRKHTLCACVNTHTHAACTAKAPNTKPTLAAALTDCISQHFYADIHYLNIYLSITLTLEQTRTKHQAYTVLLSRIGQTCLKPYHQRASECFLLSWYCTVLETTIQDKQCCLSWKKY